ncbi:TPA: Dyp-type peroxidase [Pasteurella multocida]|uniref:Dyp-type peroxidase n=1 Tax=Pasteurella multocida TaxID=747 RepID=UPI0009F25832|nr:Dyp-type peroxidase [Pasteurella multocida]MEB3453598.1 Dyp-type peroxidase [Pasteurella multocida]MEB3455719.1 Dyp-type peroxidase [Pasteurella multocida]PNM04365.1 peroxidase [Pasteurella multocida]URH74782.1 Dyp-type peroxidase [Pasteurella multocida]WRK01731.1 Dyp-type peroxidase [Pasteurella multocida]
MTAQSGVLLEHCKAAIYLEANITDLTAIPEASRQFCDKLAQLQQTYPDARLGAVVAFGDKVWKQLAGENSAKELKPFVTLGKGDASAPATQWDLLIHIQSLRPDVNFSVALVAMNCFGKAIQVEQEIHGFRWVEERDFTGFIDGTENPQAAKRAEVALIAQGDDMDGSYVFTQRYEHNLTKWEKLTTAKQEMVIGRTKPDSIELENKVETSHVGRTDLKENGVGLKILRHSLPYGKASEKHGLFFVAYCATLYNIEQQLLNMFGEKDGKTDRLLGFTKAVTGSYYFAPSLEKLKAL